MSAIEQCLHKKMDQGGFVAEIVTVELLHAICYLHRFVPKFKSYVSITYVHVQPEKLKFCVRP